MTTLEARPATTTGPTATAVAKPAARYAFAALRLGYATPEKGAWINGGHPTKGATVKVAPFAFERPWR